MCVARFRVSVALSACEMARQRPRLFLISKVKYTDKTHDRTNGSVLIYVSEMRLVFAEVRDAAHKEVVNCDKEKLCSIKGGLEDNTFRHLILRLYNYGRERRVITFP